MTKKKFSFIFFLSLFSCFPVDYGNREIAIDAFVYHKNKPLYEAHLYEDGVASGFVYVGSEKIIFNFSKTRETPVTIWEQGGCTRHYIKCSLTLGIEGSEIAYVGTEYIVNPENPITSTRGRIGADIPVTNNGDTIRVTPSDYFNSENFQDLAIDFINAVGRAVKQKRPTADIVKLEECYGEMGGQLSTSLLKACDRSSVKKELLSLKCNDGIEIKMAWCEFK